MVFDLTLPDHQDPKAKGLQTLKIVNVSALVALQFRKPVVHPGFWDVGVNACPMLMPKAASNFDDLLEPGEDEIRFAGER